jgi:hypothetical protein
VDTVYARDSRGERFILDTQNAKKWNGTNFGLIRAPGEYNRLFLFHGQWFHHQGDSLKEAISPPQTRVNEARYMSPADAADWFLAQKVELPPELADFRPKNAPAFAIPSCPGCKSPPAAIEVDDVCPKCGAYSFHCGISTHLPLPPHQGVIKVQAQMPWWTMIPPSKVVKPKTTAQEDTTPDTKRKNVKRPLKNLKELLALKRAIAKGAKLGQTMEESAMEFADGNAKKAQALLRSLRRNRNRKELS